MKQPDPAYSGQEPYVFVSYSHKDKGFVYPEIRKLQEQGINVWYDEGIDAGEEWTERLANAIGGCCNFLYFITPNSVQSEQCRRELNFADNSLVAVTAIHLSPTKLPGGLQLTLGNRQAIIKYELSGAQYLKKLAKALQFDRSRQRAADTLVFAESDAPAVEDDRKAILVLPFLSRSTEDDTGFICEGIADEIITALSSVDSLRVISRSAARQLDIEKIDIERLQQLLDIDYLLKGGVQKSGNALRITAQLLNVKSNEVLWANKWTGSVDQIFDVQESIAAGVVDGLKIRLSGKQRAKLAERPIPDVRAYEYFLRARQSIQQWTRDALLQALEYLDAGEKIIGENVYIISARGYVLWQFHNLGIDPDPEHLEEARKCIDKLFDMDPESPDAHRLAGLVSITDKGEVSSSIKHLKIALAADPNNPDTLFWLSQIYGVVGRVSSGMALAERLLKLDPITPLNRALPGVLCIMDGNPSRACEHLKRCYESDPANSVFLMLYAQALAMNERRDEAARVFTELSELGPEHFFAKLAHFYTACLQNDRDAAQAAATGELLAGSESDPQSSWTVAQCYALLGEQDKAVDWIANAISHGFWNYPLLAERDPLLEPIRKHERFQSLMSELKDKWIDLDA